MAETVAEANAQVYTLPAQLDDWRRFAVLIDGYKIAEELGISLGDWVQEKQRDFEQSGQWDLNVLELRIMIFQKQRSDYWAGYTYHEQDAAVDSLLHEISRQTGLPYPADETNSQ